MIGGREQVTEALCGVLNRVIDLDPAAHRRMRRLEGRSLGVALLGPGLRLVLKVEDNRFRGTDPDGEINAWVRATPGALLSLAASGGRATPGQLEIAGDAEAARRFQEFFQTLHPDWEEGMTRVFGDVVGVQLSRLLAGGIAYARRTGDGLSQDLGDYLRDESEELVSRHEMEAFLDAVDDLRDDVSRLEARIGRLTSE